MPKVFRLKQKKLSSKSAVERHMAHMRKNPYDPEYGEGEGVYYCPKCKARFKRHGMPFGGNKR